MGCINSKTLLFRNRNKSNTSIVSNPVIESNNDYNSGSEINLLQDYDPEISLSYLTQNLDDSVHYGDNYDNYTKNNGSNSPTTNSKNENKSVKSLDSAASLIQKQARRKAAKLRAEAEKRWLVFSNLDTVAEADMIKVSILLYMYGVYYITVKYNYSISIEVYVHINRGINIYASISTILHFSLYTFTFTHICVYMRI